MENLITSEDIYNNLNIDLASRLNVTGQANATIVVNNYITERQDEIVEYLALHNYDGRMQAEMFFTDELYTDDLKRAILQQVRYVLDNSDMNYGGILMQGGGIQKLSIQERITAMISPKAHLILANAGMLYCGRV